MLGRYPEARLCLCRNGGFSTASERQFVGTGRYEPLSKFQRPRRNVPFLVSNIAAKLRVNSAVNGIDRLCL